MSNLFGNFTNVTGIFVYLPNNPTRIPLPLLDIKAKVTITSRNTHLLLIQTFCVPEHTSISTAKYIFPLYAHSAVSSFTAHIGTKTLHAKIEKKEKAREQYDAAVAAGQTAALMNEVTAEIFTMELGNLPANTEVRVVLGVIGELKGAGEDDTSGDHTLRYTLPMTIAPKYGAPPAELGWHSGVHLGSKQGLQIEVEVLSPESIKSISSPTHPVSMGFGGQTEGGLTKMTASLSQRQTVELEKDFVLEVKLDRKSDSVKPWAILEKHPTIPGQSAVMVSFIPRLKLKKVKPEVFFVLDRSGSMGGHMSSLISAMEVFLKSLSAGVKFNICSFGSGHEFMFRDGKSRAYTEGTMEEAMRYVAGMSANFGGTELYSALKATLDARDKESDTEVIVLTDGEIWQTQEVFDLIRAEKKTQIENKKTFRLFSIGLGNGVDRNLVEGMANAGDGYATFVGYNEAFEGKVVKMLKTALSERLLDMSFHLRDAHGQSIDDPAEKDDDSEFTIVDEFTPKTIPQQSPPKKLSLFNPDQESDDELDASPATAKDAPLKPITPPNPLRAPYKVTSLLPGQRSIFYFLQAPTPLSKARDPKEVVFTATTSAGDSLELIIPVSETPKADDNDINTTIHKLAARRLIKEMEQGSTWIDDALSQQLKITKKDAPATYKRYVDQQGEAIAMKWQILSKWTSFIIVDEEGKKIEDGQVQVQGEMVPQSKSEQRSGFRVKAGASATGLQDFSSRKLFRASAPRRAGLQPALAQPQSCFGSGMPSGASASSFGSGSGFGASVSRSRAVPPPAPGGLFGSAGNTGTGLFDAAPTTNSYSAGPTFGTLSSAAPSSIQAITDYDDWNAPIVHSLSAPRTTTSPAAQKFQQNVAPTFESMYSCALQESARDTEEIVKDECRLDSRHSFQQNVVPAFMNMRGSSMSMSSVPQAVAQSQSPQPIVPPQAPRQTLSGGQAPTYQSSASAKLPSDPKTLTLELLKHATFSGAFILPDLDLTAFHISSPIMDILAVKGLSKPEGVDKKEWMKLCDTVLVVTLLKGSCASQEDVWDLVVSKAEEWIEERTEEWGYDGKMLEKVWGVVKGVVEGEEEGIDGVL